MATDLTNIFGNEIKKEKQPRLVDRQYTAYPGAHGLTSMFLGTRGYFLVFRGKLTAYGPNYQTGEANLQAIINSIEEYLWQEAADYTLRNETFSNVVFERLIIPIDKEGKQFHWNSAGYVSCEFVCEMRGLL